MRSRDQPVPYLIEALGARGCMAGIRRRPEGGQGYIRLPSWERDGGDGGNLLPRCQLQMKGATAYTYYTDSMHGHAIPPKGPDLDLEPHLQARGAYYMYWGMIPESV
ncbi:hypothetical protein CPLU01_14088 [Colletotrichum plurivorum]|uniref:Uncharacterized protein n=1 Tax=Colletotrichum plurivorum TaxID=2175906 RepID=A0A8H6JMK9_9PEZI|nr:hypothetical protein CPLU01_14088 [Colletotrichum plurivorum]